MHAHRRQVLHQAVAVVVSARRASVWLLPVIGFVTGVLFHFSRTWLSVVTLGISIVTLGMVWHILHTRHRHARALSRTLAQLEQAIQRGEQQQQRAMKKRHRGPYNGQAG